MEKIGSASSAEEHSALVRQLRSTVSVSKRKMLDEAADTIEQLHRLLEEEHQRFLRYADYSVERDRMIDQLKKDLMEADETGGCLFCRYAHEPMPCEIELTEYYDCNQCPHEECMCRSCRGDSRNWEWRGIVEGSDEADAV